MGVESRLALLHAGVMHRCKGKPCRLLTTLIQLNDKLMATSMSGDSPLGAYADPASLQVALRARPKQTSAVQAAGSDIAYLLHYIHAECTWYCMQIAKPQTSLQLLWLKSVRVSSAWSAQQSRHAHKSKAHIILIIRRPLSGLAVACHLRTSTDCVMNVCFVVKSNCAPALTLRV